VKLLAAQDSIFKTSQEYEPWHPQAIPGFYDNEPDWMRDHLWDHIVESDNTHGPYRGPSILHHPDYQYAVDNGWRPIGGDKDIDHQARGETTSGSPYLYKVDKNGLVHSAHLDTGPEEANMDLNEDEENGRGLGRYGTVPESNWRHLVTSEGGDSEAPLKYDSLRDLVDEEKRRSALGSEGYKDYEPREYRVDVGDDWQKKHNHMVNRAWETGTNQPFLHRNDPMPDPYANIDNIPRGPRPSPEPITYDVDDLRSGPTHPRYGFHKSDPNRE